MGTIVHGAILISLADTAACNAVVQATDQICMTKEIQMSFLRPAIIGQEIVAIPRIEIQKDRKWWIEVILEQSNTIVAKGKILVCVIQLNSAL